MHVVQLYANLFPGHFMSIATYIVSPLGTSDHKLRSHLQARDGGVPSGSDSLSSDWSLNLLYIY